eukprot:7386171-Prymnesium_polylepis.1
MSVINQPSSALCRACRFKSCRQRNAGLEHMCTRLWDAQGPPILSAGCFAPFVRPHGELQREKRDADEDGDENAGLFGALVDQEHEPRQK